MITDHKFRARLKGAGNKLWRMCAWLGTCNRPRSEHVEATVPRKGSAGQI